MPSGKVLLKIFLKIFYFSSSLKNLKTLISTADLIFWTRNCISYFQNQKIRDE